MKTMNDQGTALTGSQEPGNGTLSHSLRSNSQGNQTLTSAAIIHEEWGTFLQELFLSLWLTTRPSNDRHNTLHSGVPHLAIHPPASQILLTGSCFAPSFCSFVKIPPLPRLPLSLS